MLKQRRSQPNLVNIRKYGLDKLENRGNATNILPLRGVPMNSPDPLSGLIVDEAELSRAETAEVLAPYVRFTGAGELLLQPSFDGLRSDQKVLCVLLALRAAHSLQLREKSGASPAEIESASGLPGGTIRPTLTRLQKSRLLNKSGRDYDIPAFAHTRVVEILKATK